MAHIQRGRVEHGGVVLEAPVPLPEGTRVVVHVEEDRPSTEAAERLVDFTSLPFFGMWADRDDVPDSSDWVREGRARWHQRASRRD